MTFYRMIKASMLAVTVSTIVFASTKSSQDDILKYASLLNGHYFLSKGNPQNSLCESQVMCIRSKFRPLVTSEQAYFKELTETSKEEYLRQIRVFCRQSASSLNKPIDLDDDYIKQRYEENKTARVLLMPIRKLYISDNVGIISGLIDTHRDTLQKAKIEVPTTNRLSLKMREKLFIRFFAQLMEYRKTS